MFRRREISGRVGSTVKRDGPRENKVALHTVSNEGSHGYTRVLDFTLTKPGDSLFFGSSPESGIGQTKRVPVFHNGVQVCGKSLEVFL